MNDCSAWTPSEVASTIFWFFFVLHVTGLLDIIVDAFRGRG